MIKKILFVVLACCIFFCTWNCNSIIYGIEQGYHQVKIVRQAVPVSDVLKDSSFPDSIKQKLYLIQEIRQFAIDSLGINETENYNTFYDQGGQPILWVVIASPPYNLEEYQWDFPFVGSFPYKGYFVKEKAIKEALAMKEKGFDTYVSEVSAWSTLGFLKDPILSEMLSRSEGSLARLIIHELTHATLYVKNNGTFNENLATFVGDKGAVLFLKSKYGDNSDELIKYNNEIADVQKYANHMLCGSLLLDSMYISTTFNDLTINEKRRKKDSLISLIMNNSDTIQFSDKQRYDNISDTTFLPNNSFFTQFRVYREQQSDLDIQFTNEFKENFMAYLNFLKNKYGK